MWAGQACEIAQVFELLSIDKEYLIVEIVVFELLTIDKEYLIVEILLLKNILLLKSAGLDRRQ